MRDRIRHWWLGSFPRDLAVDLLTLACILAAALAMLLAALAGVNDTLAQLLADQERTIWIVAGALAGIALTCLLRLATYDDRIHVPPWMR